jgi:hypothetical protein
MGNAMTNLEIAWEQAKAEYETAHADYRSQRIELGSLQRAEDKRFYAGVRWFSSKEAQDRYHG